MNPKISIIIPTYNRAKTIESSIESILNQIYSNYEIIVIDDGSTDNTQHILDNYVDHIRYIRQENAGCASARNLGIKHANGEYIAFLDSDDKWLPQYLKWQIECIKHYNVDVCVSNILIDDGKNYLDIDRSLEFNLTRDSCLIEDPLDLTLDHNPRPVTLPGMVINKNVLNRYRSFDDALKLASDREFILKISTDMPFAYINIGLIIVDRKQDKSRLTKNRSQAEKTEVNSSHVINYSNIYFRCRNQKKYNIDRSRKILGKYLLNLSVNLCIKGDRRNSRRFALDGIYFSRSLKSLFKGLSIIFFPTLVIYKHRLNSK